MASGGLGLASGKIVELCWLPMDLIIHGFQQQHGVLGLILHGYRGPTVALLHQPFTS